jgi:hypothetical protein
MTPASLLSLRCLAGGPKKRGFGRRQLARESGELVK